MRQKILKLKSKNWKNFAVQISDILKKEIYGKYGGEVINSIREEYENDRRKKIDRLRKNFIKTATISNMDSKVNLLTKKIYKINNEVQTIIAYDFLNYVDKNKSKLLDVCPNCIQVSKYVLKSKRPNLLINYRLISVVNLLISNSISQSGKSTAGNVGEFFVSAILDSIGMKEGKEYKRQHISKSGSDTDIVLPYVEDMKDNELMVCCAIQFTSNDRLRMVSGELKSGRKFTISGKFFSYANGI